MQRQLRISLSSKHHVIIGLGLGLWVYLFLAFIGPFDIAPLRIGWRIQIMAGYGILFTLSYLTIIPFQNWIFKLYGKWSFAFEAIGHLLIFSVCLPLTYIYYKSDFILGEFNLPAYIIEMYLPSWLIILPVSIISRRFISRKLSYSQDDKLVLEGKNRLDILQVNTKDLIAVKSAGNYVEIFFLKDGILEKNLLRSTLKEISTAAPELLKTHRSYLINPAQFVSWKNNKTLALNCLDVPVSDAFRPTLIETLKTRH